jgi:hypothetical protein
VFACLCRRATATRAGAAAVGVLLWHPPFTSTPTLALASSLSFCCSHFCSSSAHPLVAPDFRPHKSPFRPPKSRFLS